VLQRPIKVTVDALARLMRVRRLGEPHITLRPEPTWLPPHVDLTADDAMWREFADVNLIDRSGRLDGDALDTITLLSRPTTEYFAMFVHKGVARSVLVATGVGSDEIVTARRTGDVVTLSSSRQEQLPETLVRQLPQMPPARIDSINVRQDALAATNVRLSNTGVSDSRSDAAALLAIGNRRLVGQGELFVGSRENGNPYRMSVNPLRYHDIRSGRLLVTLSPGYVSITPATDQLIIDRLRRAHADLLAD
jgi:hypothetical protein